MLVKLSRDLICAASIGSVWLLLPVAAMFGSPIVPSTGRYRVLWISTTAYPAKSYAEAKRQYDLNVERAEQGWKDGQSNVLQRQSNGVWIDLERRDQAFAVDRDPERP